MEIADRIRLARSRNALRETVVFKYIAAYLLRDAVINNEEFQLITSNLTKQAQMDTLLQLLNSKNRKAFLSFVSSLEEDYPWLVEDLRKSVSAQDIANYQCNNENSFGSNDINDNLINDSQLDKQGS